MMEKEVLGKYCFHDVTPKVPVDSTHTSESLDCFEMEMYQELNEMVELVALPRKRYVRDSFVKNPEFSKLSRGRWIYCWGCYLYTRYCSSIGWCDWRK